MKPFKSFSIPDSSMEIELERKLIRLENSVKDIDERLAELYREAAGLSLRNASALRTVGRDTEKISKMHSDMKSALAKLESVRSAGNGDIGSVERKVDEVRVRANAVLREIYDNVDALKAAHGALRNDVGELDRKLSMLPAGGAVPSVELPRELERLAERLAAIESTRAAGNNVDLNNLKLAVAELSNKNRLINELALENQKLQSRIFTLEEKLNALNPSAKNIM